MLRVFCLCAAWCRTCDDYRPTFDAAAQDVGRAGRFDWIDIEDDEELVGDLDVPDFPTLLIADAGQLVFLGPLTPQPLVLRRLLRSVQEHALGPVHDPGGQGFLARVAAAGR